MITYKNLSDLRKQAKAAGLKGQDRKNEQGIKDWFIEKGECFEEVKEEPKQELEVKEEVIELKSMILAKSGWCSALNKAYYKGKYTPKTVEEYNALKQYAEGE